MLAVVAIAEGSSEDCRDGSDKFPAARCETPTPRDCLFSVINPTACVTGEKELPNDGV